MKRAPGTANVEEHPKGSGKWRVRARVEGKLRTVSPSGGVSEAEAVEIADAYTVVRNDTVLREGLTVADFGTGFLDRREKAGVRAIRSDRSYWKTRVTKDPIGSLPIATLRRRDILDWRDRQSGKYRTKVRALNLLRVGLQEAVERELLEHNPARDVKVHKSGDRSALDDLTGILTPPEQRQLLEAVPERWRPLVVFALMTGLRQAEQWWLKPADLGDGLLVVRRSSKGLPPKSGNMRTVYLLGPASRAVELALAATKGPWVWPATRGGRRQEGKAPRGWRKWVTAAKLGRRIRWHDLRHTCATSLLAGWWGRKWTLDEVCQHLGHSSVTVTERYARKLAETNQRAVAGTVFPASSPLMLPASTEAGENQGADTRIRTEDLCFTNEPASPNRSARLLGGVFPRGNVKTTPGGWALGLAADRLGSPAPRPTIPAHVPPTGDFEFALGGLS